MAAQIAWKLNTRPRKSLGFKCPVELFMPDAFSQTQEWPKLGAACLHLLDISEAEVENIQAEAIAVIEAED